MEIQGRGVATMVDGATLVFTQTAKIKKKNGVESEKKKIGENEKNLKKSFPCESPS